jgi:hypothetical protein
MLVLDHSKIDPLLVIKLLCRFRKQHEEYEKQFCLPFFVNIHIYFFLNHTTYNSIFHNNNNYFFEKNKDCGI